MHQTRVSHHTASAALDFQVSLAWRSPAPELPTMRWIHWPPVPKLAWADVPSVVSALPLARDNERLSLFPELRCTATPSLTPTETQPYFAAGTGITPFRAISNLPTSPTGTSTAAFRAGSHSA